MKKLLIILLAMLLATPFLMADMKIGVSGNFEFATSSDVQSLQSGDFTKLIRPGIYFEFFDPTGFGIDSTLVTTFPDSANNVDFFLTVDPTFHFLSLKIIDLSIFAGLGVIGESNTSNLTKITSAAWFVQLGGGPTLYLGPLFAQLRGGIRFTIGNGSFIGSQPLVDDLELALIAGLKL
jgi:hypothetical protein